METSPATNLPVNANSSKALAETPTPRPIEQINSSFLKGLLGYNTRRATMMIFQLFHERMAVYDLGPIEFSVLHLIGRNPHVTPSQLCEVLDLLPPYSAKILNRFAKRHLIIRIKDQQDKRIVMLSLNEEGKALLAQAEATVARLEREAAAALSDDEIQGLITQLQKVYSSKVPSHQI